MSTIHEALKKAQKKRDPRYQVYGESLSAHERRRRLSPVWFVLLIFPILFIIFLAFKSYSWLDFRLFLNPVEPQVKLQKPAKRIQAIEVMDAKSSYERARRSHKEGDLQDAKRLYEETLRRDPDHVEALNNLGVIDIREKNYPAALKRLKEAVRLRPGYADPHYNLACLYALKGDIKEGVSHFKRAAALNPSVIEWAQADSDLDNLRTVPEFRDILRGME